MGEWDPSAPKTDLLKEHEAARDETSSAALANQPEDEQGLEAAKARQIAALDAIDRLEQEYLAEYYMLAEKDKGAGKDFNRVAHDKMVRLQAHFENLRKMERTNFQEAIN